MGALVAVVGTVTTVKNSGFQLDERPGEWMNVSKYADPKPDLPQVGQRVRLGLDGKGFVRTLDLISTAEPGTEPAVPTPTAPAPNTGMASPAHDVVMARVEILKAAASFLATRPEAKSVDVLAVAEAWERWVCR
jgi:hypothetical protein